MTKLRGQLMRQATGPYLPLLPPCDRGLEPVTCFNLAHFFVLPYYYFSMSIEMVFSPLNTFVICLLADTVPYILFLRSKDTKIF